MKKKVLALMLVLTLLVSAFALAACKKDERTVTPETPENPTPPGGNQEVQLTLSPNSLLTLDLFGESTITATVEPATTVLQWSIGDDAVAGIDVSADSKSCTVKAKKIGQTSITVTASGSLIQQHVDVKVENPNGAVPVIDIPEEAEGVALNKGDEYTISAKVLWNGDKELKDEVTDWTWTIPADQASVADVLAGLDGTATVTAKGEGTATLTVSAKIDRLAEPITATVNITVTEPQPILELKTDSVITADPGTGKWSATLAAAADNGGTTSFDISECISVKNPNGDGSYTPVTAPSFSYTVANNGSGNKYITLADNTVTANCRTDLDDALASAPVTVTVKYAYGDGHEVTKDIVITVAPVSKSLTAKEPIVIEAARTEQSKIAYSDHIGLLLLVNAKMLWIFHTNLLRGGLSRVCLKIQKTKIEKLN